MNTLRRSARSGLAAHARELDDCRRTRAVVGATAGLLCLAAALQLGAGCAAAGVSPSSARSKTGDGGITPTTPGPSSDRQCPGGGVTSVSGSVTFPNGTLPVAGALVYVTTNAAAAPRSGQCGECIERTAVGAFAETGVDGSFRLTSVPAGAQTLVIEKGKFRRLAPLQVTPCQDHPVPRDATRLPRNAQEGEVPNIAVLGGDFDRMEDVLAKLGLDRASFTLLRSGLDAFSDEGATLLRDRNRLLGYDVVFVNCGSNVAEAPLGFGQPVANEPAVQENLRAFVQGGGRLYVTDLAYELVEAVAPSLVDFVGAGDGLVETPESSGVAQVGADLSRVTATVNDEGLRAWLSATGQLGAASTMEVHGLVGGWAVVDRINDQRAKTWVSAPISWLSDPFAPPTGATQGVKPLTVTYEMGCGRALFTSYHTLEGSAPSSALSAQEQVLAYLVLEIGACIEEPTLI